MKPNASIWLTEYEGLLPAPVERREPRRRPAVLARLPHEAVGPHFELTPISLEKATPIALFE